MAAIGRIDRFASPPHLASSSATWGLDPPPPTPPRSGGVDYPRNWHELLAWFSDDAACLRYLERLRWSDGFVCRFCGVVDEDVPPVRRGTSRRRSRCDGQAVTSVAALRHTPRARPDRPGDRRRAPRPSPPGNHTRLQPAHPARRDRRAQAPRPRPLNPLTARSPRATFYVAARPRRTSGRLQALGNRRAGVASALTDKSKLMGLSRSS
jgi:Transposase zinc-ribbon domain